MSGTSGKPGAGQKPAREANEKTFKTDGALSDAKFEPLKRPVNADGFLIDRPLSPEEEGLAGPLPDREENEKKEKPSGK